MSSLVIYPRGFVGFDIGLPVKQQSQDINKLINQIRYNKKFDRTKETVISNSEIETLFKQHIQGKRFTKNFDFREKILKAGLNAFGTKDFYSWAESQTKSPFFSDTHKRFLHDTFEYIKNGKRSFPTFSWMRIIQIKDLSYADGELNYDLDRFFKFVNHASIPKDLLSIIQLWVSHPDGIEDLLMSLHILFGSEVA